MGLKMILVGRVDKRCMNLKKVPVIEYDVEKSAYLSLRNPCKCSDQRSVQHNKIESPFFQA